VNPPAGALRKPGGGRRSPADQVSLEVRGAGTPPAAHGSPTAADAGRGPRPCAGSADPRLGQDDDHDRGGQERDPGAGRRTSPRRSGHCWARNCRPDFDRQPYAGTAGLRWPTARPGHNSDSPTTLREQLMSTILIEPDDGEPASASAVLRVRATNAEYNQPALRIDQASKRGGAASIKIVDPNPDIEFVESDVAASTRSPSTPSSRCWRRARPASADRRSSRAGRAAGPGPPPGAAPRSARDCSRRRS
jgi:hypothetical protein